MEVDQCKAGDGETDSLGSADDALLVTEELAVLGIKSTYVCVYVCRQRVTSKVAGKGTRHWSGVVGKEQDMGRPCRGGGAAVRTRAPLPPGGPGRRMLAEAVCGGPRLPL